MSNPEQDIAKYEEEIAYFYRKRGMFLGIALGCLGLGIFFAVIAIVSLIYAFVYPSAFAISAFIVLMIVRGALFNRRIRNRKLLIQQIKVSQKYNEPQQD